MFSQRQMCYFTFTQYWQVVKPTFLMNIIMEKLRKVLKSCLDERYKFVGPWQFWLTCSFEMRKGKKT